MGLSVFADGAAILKNLKIWDMIKTKARHTLNNYILFKIIF